MKRRLLIPALTIGAFCVGVAYGLVILKYKVFPHRYLKSIFHRLDGSPENPYGHWSVGIYEGKDLFSLRPAQGVQNPVLSAKDVVDLDCAFVADPFLVQEQGKYYLFVEVLNRDDGGGNIAYAESDDGRKWTYRKVVVDEPFHLSYPYVFKFNGDYYMIPESVADVSVRLYKAERFPDRWKYQGNLISGLRFVDCSILRYRDKWWLFVTNRDNDLLNIYYCDSLLGKWQRHPENPIIKLDRRYARGAGRIIEDGGKLYRFAQDDEDIYGKQVFAFEILELSEKHYREKLVRKPIVAATGEGWNAKGMHTVGALRSGNGLMAVVDGRDQ